jgi:uncharacterized membrane protein
MSQKIHHASIKECMGLPLGALATLDTGVLSEWHWPSRLRSLNFRRILRHYSWNHLMYYFCIIFAIAIGILFRVANLDHIVYWGDEVYSAIRIFGYTTQEIYQAIGPDHLVTAATLQSFQRFTPTHGIGTVLQGLAAEDAHITPLYFLVMHCWTKLFGSSTVSIRSFSVLCGIALMPATYWLAIELFQRRRIALCTTALIAISPVQLLFAQEARMYALWCFLTILAGAAMLRAVRVNRWGAWLGAGLAMTGSLYAHFLAAIPLAGYGLYTILLHWRDQGIRKRFGITVSLSLLSFMPWAWIFLTRRVMIQEDGTQTAFSLTEAAKNWFSLFRRSFLDFNTTFQHGLPMAVTLVALSGLCALLVAIAIYRMQRETRVREWLFVGLLILGLPLGLLRESLYGILPSRYLLPSYVGMHIAVGYLLGSRIGDRHFRRLPQQWIWNGALIALISLGVYSGGAYAQASSWWNKAFSECNPAIAQQINRSPRPLVISDGTGGPFFDHALSNVISLARLVKPETQFQFSLESEAQEGIAAATERGEFSDRYVFTPSKVLREALQAKYGDRMEPLMPLTTAYRDSDTCLWQLKS